MHCEIFLINFCYHHEGTHKADILCTIPHGQNGSVVIVDEILKPWLQRKESKLGDDSRLHTSYLCLHI